MNQQLNKEMNKQTNKETNEEKIDRRVHTITNTCGHINTKKYTCKQQLRTPKHLLWGRCEALSYFSFQIPMGPKRFWIFAPAQKFEKTAANWIRRLEFRKSQEFGLLEKVQIE